MLIPVQKIKKKWSRDRRNWCIQWNTHTKYRKKHNWNCMAGLVIRNPDSCITSKVVHSTTELSRPINSHGPNYHIPALTKFLSSKNTQQTHIHFVRFHKLSQYQINRKERKYRNKHFFSIEEGKRVNKWKIPSWFKKKNNTDPFTHLHVHHVPVLKLWKHVDER